MKSKIKIKKLNWKIKKISISPQIYGKSARKGITCYYFIGFIEPNKITSGECDIIISDGYTGNIMLKSAEGISNFITSNLRSMFQKSIKTRLASIPHLSIFYHGTL